MGFGCKSWILVGFGSGTNNFVFSFGFKVFGNSNTLLLIVVSMQKLGFIGVLVTWVQVVFGYQKVWFFRQVLGFGY